MNFEFKLPDIGEGVVEGEVVRWLIQEGEQLREDQPMLEVMTDKATVEITSPVSGKVVRKGGEEGDIVEVGSTLLTIALDKDSKVPVMVGHGALKAHFKPVGKKAKAPRSGRVLATPAVRRMARELGVDISRVQGSGPGGRVIQQDLQRASEAPTKASKKADRAGEAAAEESVPYRGIRRKVGDHLVFSKRSAPHYTYVEEADVTELVGLRRELLSLHPEENVRLTYLPFIVKAVATGLKEYPLVNASLNEEKGVILLKKHYNIGIATATPEGLMVPVVKNADQKELLELAREIQDLSESVRSGKTKLENLRDGTFTITSLGSLGGVMATPIINTPEVAILGVHKISPKPVVRDGQIVIRQMTNLSLSLDHRVVDGAVGAAFLHHVLRLIEHPELIFPETG